MKHSIEVIKEGGKLLMKTCRNSIVRSNHKEGTYKDVKCSFKSAKKFFYSIKSNKKLYNKWLDLTYVYLVNGRPLRLRPTFDRVNAKGHYYINNIQVLTYGENSAKARRKNK
jgi:hypothetical protein